MILIFIMMPKSRANFELRVITLCIFLGIVFLTDGIVGLSSVSVFESLLTSLRNNHIVCHFLQLRSCYTPSTGIHLHPDIDLLQFIARGTFGTYLPSLPVVVSFIHFLNFDEIIFLTLLFLIVCGSTSLIFLVFDTPPNKQLHPAP